MESLQALISTAAEHNPEVRCHMYSGRGMFGNQCVGISGRLEDVHAVMADVLVELKNIVVDAAIEASNEQEEEVADRESRVVTEYFITLLRFSQDSMGLGAVIYWPELEWVKM